MINIKFKYVKYFLVILIIYTLFLILNRIINISSLLLLLILCVTTYYLDKKKFKKIVYKIIYRDKKKRLSFKNKFGAARLSLNSIEEINKSINDKVKFDLINYEKNN